MLTWNARYYGRLAVSHRLLGAIQRLELNGLNVISVTADGAPVRTENFFGCTKIPKIRKPLSTKHEIHSQMKTDGYISLLTPHLIKTVRNCWLHSGFGGTRLLKVNVNTVAGCNYILCIHTCL